MKMWKMWWQYLEINREVITNGLDLVSFILITPELVKYAIPALKAYFRLFIGLLLGGALIYPLYLIVDAAGHLLNATDYTSWIFGTIVIAIGIGIRRVARSILHLNADDPDAADAPGKLADLLFEQYMAKHMFAIAAVLFFLSRCLALSFALSVRNS
jgi:hypothetical protein